VLQRLDATRQKWWLFSLLTTTVMAASVSLGLLMAFMLCDALWRLPRAGIVVLSLVWLGVTLGMAIGVGRLLLGRQRTLEGAARRIEAAFPELASDLINLVQLSQDPGKQHRGFRASAVQQMALRLQGVRFEAAAQHESRWHRFRHAMQTPRDLLEWTAILGLLIVLGLVLQAVLSNWGSAARRLLTPWEFVPSIGTIGEIHVQHGNTEVLVGASVEIIGEIHNPEGEPQRAVLHTVVAGERESSVPMQGDRQQQRFTAILPALLKPVRYRLEIGDSQSPVYTITVRERPSIEEVRVAYRYPSYMEREPVTVAQKHADLQAPQYTVAEIHIRARMPIASGYIQSGNERAVGQVRENGTVLHIERFPLLKDGTFVIHLADSAGHGDPEPRVNHVRVLPDKPPAVELLKPLRQGTAAPGGQITVAARATDDWGLGQLRVEMKLQPPATEGPNDAPTTPPPLSDKPTENGQPAESGELGETIAPPETIPIQVLQQWSGFTRTTTLVRQCELSLEPSKYQPGQTLWLRAVATDKRYISDWGLNLRPQETASPWHAVRIVSAEVQNTAALQQVEHVRGALWKILEKQLRARVQAAGLLPAQPPLARGELVAAVRAQQVDIQRTSVAVVETIANAEQEELRAIRRVLGKLAFDEMLAAVGLCDRLEKEAEPTAAARQCEEMLGLQDRIIATLRNLLDAARNAESDLLAEMKKRPSGDLPDEVKKKFEEARDRLDEFLKQQRKVIEATENLAKTPVADFRETEEQKLRELAAAQDDWSRFMKELHSDLSKLPEQDFANPSVLQELVAIQTELKMAEDALRQRAADIAVPLEQLGYERAEELMTNIEKWLPDTPDRERWSQEESLTDQDKEAPMAELPGELEDLVGELLEEEEDLFDEMEDISSSAADSLDKGAGWDTLDGPISNMSAKGATGNRLPNTSEIGGRSGEGRSGKSSGEMVSEEAVGKGGRKTPSRLTPDPYQKGQIKDRSQDPTGGATGGGKESGQGGQGLEGPVPKPLANREMQRLAGKQAALRNKAEGIDLRFQVLNYHHTDLRKLIETMAQVERDLRAGRYQNALRQRKVLLDGLREVKQYVEGEFTIKRDTSVNLPSEIQKEILNAMEDSSPPGWEELNRQYFERLAKPVSDATRSPTN
jgi:hypothetical protein